MPNLWSEIWRKIDLEIEIEAKADKTDLDNVKANQLVHANQVAGLALNVSNLNENLTW